MGFLLLMCDATYPMLWLARGLDKESLLQSVQLGHTSNKHLGYTFLGMLFPGYPQVLHHY